jgi:soluble lytic murein transglycosylase-like protein
MDWSDFYLFLFTTSAKVVFAVMAISFLWWSIRRINHSVGVKARDHLAIIASNPIALAVYRGALWIGVSLILGLVISCTPAAASSLFPNKYDGLIKSATAQWMPGVDWKLWKAQLFQESRLDPNARSPVGAEGLAQFMPGTWKDVTKALGWELVDRRLAAPSIEAGAYYMRKLRVAWHAPRSEVDRHNLAMASYNAGLGNILKAQKLCGGLSPYSSIIACLPEVTGPHADETLSYVPRIRRWHIQMV